MRAVRLGLGEEDAPAVVGHLDVVEVGPALLADGDRRAQVDVVVLEGDRAELLPPLDELRLPRLERPLQPAVAGEVDVVRDLGVDVDDAHLRQSLLTPSLGRRSGASRCRSGAARPRARRRWVAGRSSSARPSGGRRSSSPSSPGPTKRKLASIPVSASGEKLVRSSSISRTSSSQSRSSGANVTSPASTRLGREQVLADRARGPRRARRRGPRTGSPAGDSPFAIGYQPSLASVSRSVGGGAGRRRPRVPSSMNVRSAASASSASVPAKQLPGSTARRACAPTGRGASASAPRTAGPRGRASGPRRRRAASSAGSTASASPLVCSTHVPTSGSLKRRCRMASSSSRAAASDPRAGAGGDELVAGRRAGRRRAAHGDVGRTPSSRSMSTSTCVVPQRVVVDRRRPSGVSVDARARRSGRSELAARASARSRDQLVEAAARRDRRRRGPSRRPAGP